MNDSIGISGWTIFYETKERGLLGWRCGLAMERPDGRTLGSEHYHFSKGREIVSKLSTVHPQITHEKI
jgi:hypothetical protein